MNSPVTPTDNENVTTSAIVDSTEKPKETSKPNSNEKTKSNDPKIQMLNGKHMRLEEQSVLPNGGMKQVWVPVDKNEKSESDPEVFFSFFCSRSNRLMRCYWVRKNRRRRGNCGKLRIASGSMKEKEKEKKENPINILLEKGKKDKYVDRLRSYDVHSSPLYIVILWRRPRRELKSLYERDFIPP